ncbi:MAG: gluconeogenesis factor YvcK family protein [Aggregatilineales bacterium]
MNEPITEERTTNGLRVAALGGGHGLPVVLRAFKPYTTDITAIVTMADDGGSSGRLRREMGVLPPGDLRNNIAALADDEALMTQVFQYRFGDGSLGGHSLGNLLITALANITGSMDKALVAAGHVLAIRGRVLPATLQDVTLIAERRTEKGILRITGESNIPNAEGVIEHVWLEPQTARAFPATIQAILGAQLIVFGPGSLFTSILPTLLIEDITRAIRAAAAPCVYVCNIATQPGETDGFTVADHVDVLERHLGGNLIKAVVANDTYPTPDSSSRTHYVKLTDDDRARLSKAGYPLHTADLTDPDRPWRHDPAKLARVLLSLVELLPHPA